MGGLSRRKGQRFERDVARMFEDAGFHVRGLESGGDHLCLQPPGPDGQPAGVPLHVECKRAERLKLPEWLDQLERDAPEGGRRVLVFKQSRRPVYAVVPVADYLALVREHEVTRPAGEGAADA